jgi:hypothetical protein
MAVTKTTEEYQQELGVRYDELAGGRKKLLSDVEKALDALDRKAGVLLEHD